MWQFWQNDNNNYNNRNWALICIFFIAIILSDINWIDRMNGIKCDNNQPVKETFLFSFSNIVLKLSLNASGPKDMYKYWA